MIPKVFVYIFLKKVKLETYIFNLEHEALRGIEETCFTFYIIKKIINAN